MQYRKASEKDYQGILDLQDKYLITNLNDEEKKNGFLSVKFSKKQFEIMNTDSLVVVCEDKDIIIGYLCASTADFNKDYTLPSTMIDQFPFITYQGKSLENYNCLIFGPVCIELDYRGKGVYAELMKTLIELLPKNIDVLVTFISAKNKRSLISTKKLAIEKLGDFTHMNQDYVLVAKFLENGIALIN